MTCKTCKQMGVNSFIDGVQDTLLQQALRFGRYAAMKDALVYALEYEAAKIVSRQQCSPYLIRSIKEREEGCSEVISALEEFLKNSLSRKDRLSKFCLSKDTNKIDPEN